MLPSGRHNLLDKLVVRRHSGDIDYVLRLLSLDQSAVDTVKTWKFQPAMKAGKTVPVGVMVEISFKIF